MTATYSNSNVAQNHHQRTAGSFADHEPGLWRAVITQALMDAASQSHRSETRRTREDALRWLLGNSADFEAVCDNAGFDPSYVRRRTREAMQRNFEWRLPNGEGWRTQGRLTNTIYHSPSR